MSFLDEQPDKMTSIHENYSRDETVVGGSVRSFGIVMTTALVGVSLLNWWLDGRSWRWTGGLAALLLAATLFHPAALKPFNWLWLKFGLVLHKVISPIVMAFIFFGTVLPTGLIMRALGKDPLRLKWQPSATSYWIERRPPGPKPESMKDQF
jgi:hypothetical protein